MMLDIKP